MHAAAQQTNVKIILYNYTTGPEEANCEWSGREHGPPAFMELYC